MKNTVNNREGFNPDVRQYGYNGYKSYESREAKTKRKAKKHDFEKAEARRLIKELIASLDRGNIQTAAAKVSKNALLSGNKGLIRRLKRGISKDDVSYLKTLADKLKS